MKIYKEITTVYGETWRSDVFETRFNIEEETDILRTFFKSHEYYLIVINGYDYTINKSNIIAIVFREG